MLSREDIVDIPSYYARSPGSGFFVLSFKNVPIGCIALDAATPDTDVPAVNLDIKQEPTDKKAAKELKKNKKATMVDSKHALIRHFHVDSPYRQTGVEDDLIAHALLLAFSSPSTVQTVLAATSSLVPSTTGVWRSVGFRKSNRSTEGGDGRRYVLSGVRRGWMEIGKADWERKLSQR